MVKMSRVSLLFLLGTLGIYVMPWSLALTFYLEKAPSFSCVPIFRPTVSLLWLDWEYWEVFFLLCLMEASPAMLCPVLSSSVQEKIEHTREKGHKGLVLAELMLGFQIECPIAAVPKTESANPEQHKLLENLVWGIITWANAKKFVALGVEV